MKTYLLSLLVASLAVAVVGILCPMGEGTGLSKHVHLVCALLLLCVLLSPLSSAMQMLGELANGNLTLPSLELDTEKDYSDRLNSALDATSRTYFEELLRESLEEEFSIARGEVGVRVAWDGEGKHPTKVTVLLSGNAIWKSPHEITVFVSSLLGCECVCAIE